MLLIVCSRIVIIRPTSRRAVSDLQGPASSSGVWGPGAELRLDRGLSQEQLAELADLHRTYVGSVERGERNVSLDAITALAEALGCEVRDLF